MQFYDPITEFIFVEHKPEAADIIFVPGGPYPDSARYAAELYKQGYAPYIMPSGKYTILKEHLELPEELWNQLAEGPVGKLKESLKTSIHTECDYLCEVMRQAGVPEDALLKEEQATYTYENAIYSRKLLEESGIQVKKAILCCQAFHARRSLLYYQEQFPEVEFLVCPVITKGISRTTWHQTEKGIDTVLGEMQRCGGQFHEIMRKYRNT